MKNYKLVNSKEVQEKAFRLGYKWQYTGITVSNLSSAFLYIHSDKILSCNNSETKEQIDYFLRHKYEEITQKDFLALPEPIKVGDWVMHFFERTIEEDTFDVFEAIPVINISEDGKHINEDGEVYLPIKNCTKLTPEQIKVLGLEE